MNARTRIILGCWFLLASAPLRAQDPNPPPTPPALPLERAGDLVSVFGGNLHIPPEMILSGDVVCVGGDVRIEGRVQGDVVVILGSLDLAGSVDGDVATVVSRQNLHGAAIDGDLVSVMGSTHLLDSRVDGQLVNVFGSVDRDELTRIAESALNLGFGPWVRDLWSFMNWIRLAHKLAIFVLLLLVLALAADRVRVMGEEAPVRYVAAFFMGLLGYLGLLVILGLLLVTVVGVPLGLLAFAVLKWMGLAAIFLAIGSRIGRLFGSQMSTLGAVLLSFALYAAVFLAPAALGFGALQIIILAVLRLGFFLLFEVPAVGLVILTRAGAARTPLRTAPAVVVGPAAP